MFKVFWCNAYSSKDFLVQHEISLMNAVIIEDYLKYTIGITYDFSILAPL
jgi:hypothetical protein